jgi:hypothetical protein
MSITRLEDEASEAIYSNKNEVGRCRLILADIDIGD